MKTISFRIPEGDLEELDTIAGNLQRDRTYVLNEAVQDYLHWVRNEIAITNEAIAEADREGWIPHAEVFAEFNEKRANVRAKQRKAS